MFDFLMTVAFVLILCGIFIRKKLTAHILILLSLLLMAIAGISIGEVRIALFPILLSIFVVKFLIRDKVIPTAIKEEEDFIGFV